VGDKVLLRVRRSGADDADAEEWRASVQDDQLRVLAATGPHGGAVGIAERIEEDPRTLAAQ
jgi:hypothetical protein